MPSIRAYSEKDKESVREICLRTANDDYPFTTVEEYPAKDYLLTLYCDYYVECEPENCFVLTDSDDVAVGYIMCAKNHADYSRVFMKKYRPRLSTCSMADRINGVLEVLLHGVFAAKYPAHLHIDLLKGFRGSGNGGRMMETLLNRLRANSVKGIHLVVSENNKAAIRFYERCGFRTLLKFGRGRVMGIQL